MFNFNNGPGSEGKCNCTWMILLILFIVSAVAESAAISSLRCASIPVLSRRSLRLHSAAAV